MAIILYLSRMDVEEKRINGEIPSEAVLFRGTIQRSFWWWKRNRKTCIAYDMKWRIKWNRRDEMIWEKGRQLNRRKEKRWYERKWGNKIGEERRYEGREENKMDDKNIAVKWKANEKWKYLTELREWISERKEGNNKQSRRTDVGKIEKENLNTENKKFSKDEVSSFWRK